MAALKSCFEEAGATDVATLIASGNVVFKPPPGPATRAALTQSIEALLRSRFKTYEARAAVLTRRQVQAVVDRAPGTFGAEPKEYRYMVLFLMPPLTAAAALKIVPLKEGVDEIAPGPGVLYHARLEKKAASSKLSRLASMPIYQQMTLRSWNTTAKLLGMLTKDLDIP